MSMMKSLTFKTRLAALIAVLLVLMAATGLLTLWQLHGVTRTIDSVYRDRLVPMQQLRHVSQGLAVELPAVARRLADGRLAPLLARQELAQLERGVREHWTGYLATVLLEPELLLIARTEPLVEATLKQLAQLQELAHHGDATALQRFSAQLQPAVEPLARLLDELIEVQLAIGKRESETGLAAFDRAAWLVLGLVLVTLAMASGLGWSIWLRHRREQGDVEDSRLRVQQFYIALSQTNQLIVRAPGSALQLYEGLCRICVATGQARLATVVLLDGEHFERVASHGPADRLMPGVPPRWRADSPFAQASMASEAVRSQHHVLRNRVLEAAPLAQRSGVVIPPGVEAMAAFPLRRAGRVIGALSLLAGERDFFDAPLVQLLDEMVNDVSFALDNLDRELARREALAQAETGLALFRRLFNTSAVSVIVTTEAEARVVEINEIMCARYGYRRDELIGHPLAAFGVGLNDEDRARFYAQMRQHGRVRNMEARVRTRDGSLGHSLVSGDLIDYEGQVCVLSTSIDITELRAAQQEAQARASAETANRAKTEFLAQMSHELRTPLNALLGFTQLLEADAQSLPPQQRAWLGHMRRAGWHLLGLIDDVLDISRIEAGRLTVQREPVALEPLLAEALALSEGLAREHRLRLLAPAALAPGLAVTADRRRLQQVLLNLLSNAAKYNRPGGSITVRVDVHADTLDLVVSDTGLGMDAEQLAHLFEPFNRLGRELAGIEGSGIGLALSRQLMTVMGGRIEIDSAPGRGTEARLCLPRTRLPAAPPRRADVPAPGAGPATRGTVLYIEDHAVNRVIVEQMLARWPGLRFESAADGESGLRRAAALQPDLVLLDMQLPDLNGLELLRRLKRDPATAGLRVVALSASAMADEVEAVRQAGALDYWTKPLELASFLEKMRSLLDTPPPAP